MTRTTGGDDANEMSDDLLSVLLGSGRTATAITAGADHTCALLDDGSVKCWGYNGIGQLGLGDNFWRGDGPGEMGDALPAVALGTGRTATSVTAGTDHVCALLDDATVKCWGDAGFGQLGQGGVADLGDGPGEMGDALPAVALGAERTSVAIVAGSNHSCALLDNGSVKCWGANSSGQLGLGDTIWRGDGPGEMGDALPAVALGSAPADAVAVAGDNHTCALLDDGSVKCWGSNSLGQAGLGDTLPRGDEPGEMGDSLPAVALGTNRTATAISAGDNHTCALLDDGSVKCWGYNASGQLGLGDKQPRGDGPGEMGDSLPAVALGTNRTAMAIATGAGYTCALLDDASVKCWGTNSFGQLGLGDTVDKGDGPNEMGDDLPVLMLGTNRTATAISAGDLHACALLDDASVKCWGTNGSGQLGLGDTIWRGDGPGEMGDALPAVDLGTSRTATGVSAGNDHTCALLDDASVKCWGANSFGQLGLGDMFPHGDEPGEMGDLLPAVALGTNRTATEISAGRDHTCALLDDASVKCWGANSFGQLGLGDMFPHGDEPGEMGDLLPAVALGTNRTATEISAGRDHTCALLDDASVKCWGANSFGQLGLGDTFPRGDELGEMGDALPQVALLSASAIVRPVAPGLQPPPTAVAANASATVNWAAPPDNGGSPVTGYRVERSSDGVVWVVSIANTASTSVVVGGLANGTTYRFRVTAINAIGAGVPTLPSNAVTPMASATVPGSPTGVSGTRGNGQVSVSWSAPASTGGSPITGYTVTASPGGATCSATGTTECTVTGLTNGVTYTFTVTAANAVGTGAASAPSSAVTPVGVPGAPTDVAVFAVSTEVFVIWSAPSSTGGSPITGYTVTASPGGATCSATGTTECTVIGLTNGVTYTFTVAAANAVGTGPASAPSMAVTPQPPVRLFGSVTPFRATDTRAGGVKVGSEDGLAGPLRVKVTGRGGVPASGVGAVSLNVTVDAGELADRRWSGS